MKTIILLCLLIGSQHIFAASCDIEKGHYLILKVDQLKVKVDSCDPTPGWGQGRAHFATFDKNDLARAKRELLTKHHPLIPDRCQLLGTGDIEIISNRSLCSFSGVDEATANFTVRYKCHLF